MRAERALSRDATSAADLDAKLLFYYYARSSFSGAAVSRKTTPCHFNAQARAWKASWPPLKLFHLSPLKRSQLSFFCLCVTVRMPYAPYLLSFFPQIRRVLFFCFRNSQSATNFFFASQVEVCFFSFFCLFLFFLRVRVCVCACLGSLIKTISVLDVDRSCLKFIVGICRSLASGRLSQRHHTVHFVT